MMPSETFSRASELRASRAHTRWTPGSKVGKRTLLAAVKGTDARATFVLEPPEVAAPVKTATPAKAVPAATKAVTAPKAQAPVKKGSNKRASQ